MHRVAGTGFLSDMFADFSDVFGGRSGTYRHQLESLYAEAVEQLNSAAEMRGGNWILGFHADFDEISGKNKQMFMLVAMGTAVRARRDIPLATNVHGEGQIGVSGLEVSAVIREQRLLRQLEANQQIDVEGWDFLAERRKDGAISSAVSLISTPQPGETFENPPRQQAAYRYLRALPLESVSTELYRILAADASLSLRALSVIQDLRLGRPDIVKKMIDSRNPHVRWVALQSLRAASTVYRQDDIEVLEQLRSSVPKALLARTLVVRKKSFGREKEEWECVCGTWAHANERCGQCSRDPYGIGPTDLSPQQAVNLLDARIEALRLIYADSGTL